MTIIANARYLLMSCAMSQRFSPDTPMNHRFLVAFDLTDELFSNAELRVIRDPQVPLAPSNPVDLKPYRMRACVGAMLAASLIVSVLFLLFKLFQKKIQKFMHFSLYIVINSTANHKTTCKANCTTKALLYRLFIFIT